MVHLALKAADEPTKKVIEAIVGDHAATEKELHQLRTLFQQAATKSGALKKGEQYAAQAKKAAHTAASWGHTEAVILESILTFAMEREN